MEPIKTRTGIMEGTLANNGVQAFLGIPYAQQPVGALRWKPPLPLPASDEHISCKEFGPTAVQKEDPVELASMNPQGEDCLSLNVWVADPSKKNQPVMVYVHGGAYFSGGSSDPLYNGQNFAKRHDVVLVSINYRINLFGSLCLSALPGGEDYQEAGYLNLMDQVAALNWIKDNIAAFGGDPDNITLFGESAGSASMALLGVTPAAKGLFKRAICESGPIQLYKTPEKGAPYAKEFAEICGCTTVQDLLAKSTDELVAGLCELCDRHTFEVSLIFSPVCDGAYIPRKPMRAWKDGAAADIDFMIGCTDDEFSYFSFYFKPEEMPAFWHGQTPFHFDDAFPIEDWEEKYRQAYPDRDFIANYLDFMNNTGFFVGADLMAEEQSAYNKIYNYRFKYKSTIEGMGACHAIEVPFVMENLDTPDGLEFTGPNPPQSLADKMNDTWYAFASTGNPSTPELGEWPPFTAKDHAYLVMDEKTWSVERDINEKNFDLFRPMYKSLIED